MLSPCSTGGVLAGKGFQLLPAGPQPRRPSCVLSLRFPPAQGILLPTWRTALPTRRVLSQVTQEGLSSRRVTSTKQTGHSEGILLVYIAS